MMLPPRPASPLLTPLQALALTLAVIVVVFHFRLIPAAIVGGLVFVWSSKFARRLDARRVPAAPIVSSVAVSVLVIGFLVGLVAVVVALLRSDEMARLLINLPNSLAALRAQLPARMGESIPTDLEALTRAAADWLRLHAAALGQASAGLAHLLVQLIFAIATGGTAAVYYGARRIDALDQRLRFGRLADVLDRVIVAQVWIAAFNTLMTAIFFFLILPAIGFAMPFAKTLTALTFFVSLAPVAGNLTINTLVALVSLTVSPLLALASVAFLIVIHKTEYVINARVIGPRVRTAAWEILAAIVLGEALFGIQGVVAAPLLYPYLKRELEAIRAERAAAAATVTPGAQG
jgi:predicted PurR-regulated permease PerM